MLKSKLLRFVLTPFFVFLASYVALVLFFSQQSGHILWENLLASGIFAVILGFFAFLCMLKKWFFFGWLGATVLFAGMAYLAGWESFSINYFYGNSYDSACPVSFYCFDTESLGPLYLLIKAGVETIFLFDLIIGAAFGVIILKTLVSLYPQTRYFSGAFVFGFFFIVLFMVQKIPDVPNYSALQYGVLGVVALMTLASLCFGIFYKTLSINNFKKIYVATVIALVFAMPILIPFDISTEEDQEGVFIARIFFGVMAILSFIYFGFFFKPRSATQTLNSSLTINRSKNKRTRH